MTVIQHSLKLPYSTTEMYELVNDVEAYAQFLPWCTESRVLSRHEDEVSASLTLNMGGFSRSLTTCNRLQKDKRIAIRLIEGPLRHLDGLWSFVPTDAQGSTISLHLEFEVMNRLLDFAFGLVLQKAADSSIQAFVQRAKQLYGDRPILP